MEKSGIMKLLCGLCAFLSFVVIALFTASIFTSWKVVHSSRDRFRFDDGFNGYGGVRMGEDEDNAKYYGIIGICLGRESGSRCQASLFDMITAGLLGISAAIYLSSFIVSLISISSPKAVYVLPCTCGTATFFAIIGIILFSVFGEGEFSREISYGNGFYLAISAIVLSSITTVISIVAIVMKPKNENPQPLQQLQQQPYQGYPPQQPYPYQQGYPPQASPVYSPNQTPQYPYTPQQQQQQQPGYAPQTPPQFSLSPQPQQQLPTPIAPAPAATPTVVASSAPPPTAPAAPSIPSSTPQTTELKTIDK